MPHQWTAFVRSLDVNNKFPNNGIKKVIFQLHPDFDPPTVEVEKAPFEVKRCGAGVFPLGVQVHFEDGHMKEASI